MKTYFHVFWIPILPLWGSQATVCPHCKATEHAKSIPEPTRNRLNSLRNEIKTPKWMFAGLFIMGFFFVVPLSLGMVAAFLESNHEEEYVRAPRIQDLYIVNREGYGTSSYFVMKLQSINAEKYQFQVSKKQYEFPSEAKSDIDAGLYKQKESYAPEILTLEKEKLMALKKNGDLDSIVRPDTAE